MNELPDIQDNKAPESPLADSLHTIGKITGYADTPVAGINIPGGAARGFLTTTGLGIGGGYLASKLINLIRGDDDPEAESDRTKNWMLVGGIGAALPAALISLAGYTASKNEKAASVHTKSIMTGLLKRAGYTDWMLRPVVPVEQTAWYLLGDPVMTPDQKGTAIGILMHAADNQPEGHLSVSDLIRGAVGAGLGYATATAVGKAMGGLFGMSPGMKNMLSSTGAIGGGLIGAGLTR